MTDSAPFFSICIPNYNYHQYIGKTIESVLNQSFHDFEIIISDNASTDTSIEVVKKYIQSDSRIKLIQNHCNIGFAPNLQRVTQEAKGRFVILLSSDDIMYEDALQVYYDVLMKQGITADKTVLHAAFDQINSDGEYLLTAYRKAGSFAGMISKDRNGIGEMRLDMQDPIQAVKYALQTNKGIGAFLTICYPRSLWKEVEGYDTQYYIFPDKAFLVKLLLKKPAYVYVNQSLFGYRIHNNNQNAKNAGQAALKHQVDGYMRVVNFSQDDLNVLGMSREQLKFYFVVNLCERHAYSALRNNFRLKAFRILCFSLATFPGIALKRGRTWLLFGLLMFGPLGYLLLRIVYQTRIYHD